MNYPQDFNLVFSQSDVACYTVKGQDLTQIMESE